MSANVSSVLSAVKTAVASASGLSNRVVIGLPPAGKPAAVPWGYVWLESVQSAQDVELGGYRRMAEIGVRIYVGATTDTPEARTVAADQFVERFGAEMALGDPADRLDVAQAARTGLHVRFEVVTGVVVTVMA